MNFACFPNWFARNCWAHLSLHPTEEPQIWLKCHLSVLNPFPSSDTAGREGKLSALPTEIPMKPCTSASQKMAWQLPKHPHTSGLDTGYFCGHKLELPIGGSQRAGTCALLSSQKNPNTWLTLISPCSPAPQPSRSAGHCRFPNSCLHSRQPSFSGLASLLSAHQPVQHQAGLLGTAREELFGVPSFRVRRP